YNLKSSVVVTDPSDNDTAKIDTYKNVMGFLTIGFRVIEKYRVSFFLQGGGGGYFILDAERVEYTTSKNYILRIEPPGKKFGFTGFAGFGVEYKFSKNIGVIFSARYLYIAAETPQSPIITQLGLRYTFK
ncbi:MAG: hypothetical protein L0Y73_05410, partial [Candidatus Aminicenantes bacterium]|nr:hypothetical protein [Candidatus Aminicenantes bacterium]